MSPLKWITAATTLMGMACAPYEAHKETNGAGELGGSKALQPESPSREISRGPASEPAMNNEVSAPPEEAEQKLPEPSAPIEKPFSPHPLLWEANNKSAVMWSAYTMQVIGSDYAGTYLRGAKDVGNFCPKFKNLGSSQKINFWAFLLSAITKYESNFKPVTRFREPGLGRDLVTNEPVYSEGLLQLSYQDAKIHNCEFDWSRDRHLSPKDPRKTIFDPLKNLKCGIGILAAQLRRSGNISVNRGEAYWSVLQPSGRYSKVRQIQTLTRRMPFC